MTRPAGFSVVEALVGTLLAGVALAGLAAVAGLATRALTLARDTSVAIALAGERLEAMRAGPRADGSDTVTGLGTTFTRRWSTTGGRGLPAELRVAVAWGAHTVEVATEALP